MTDVIQGGGMASTAGLEQLKELLNMGVEKGYGIGALLGMTAGAWSPDGSCSP